MKFVHTVTDLIVLGLVDKADHLAVHHHLLQDGFEHGLFEFLANYRLHVLGVDIVCLVQSLQVPLIVEEFNWYNSLLIEDIAVLTTKSVLDPNFRSYNE